MHHHHHNARRHHPSLQPTSQEDLSLQDLNKARKESWARAASRWSSIIDKYSKIDDEFESDLIDLDRGRVVVDNGHLRSLGLLGSRREDLDGSEEGPSSSESESESEIEFELESDSESESQKFEEEDEEDESISVDDSEEDELEGSEREPEGCNYSVSRKIKLVEKGLIPPSPRKKIADTRGSNGKQDDSSSRLCSPLKRIQLNSSSSPSKHDEMLVPLNKRLNRPVSLSPTKRFSDETLVSLSKSSLARPVSLSPTKRSNVNLILSEDESESSPTKKIRLAQPQPTHHDDKNRNISHSKVFQFSSIVGKSKSSDSPSPSNVKSPIKSHLQTQLKTRTEPEPEPEPEPKIPPILNDPYDSIDELFEVGKYKHQKSRSSSSPSSSSASSSTPSDSCEYLMQQVQSSSSPPGPSSDDNPSIEPILDHSTPTKEVVDKCMRCRATQTPQWREGPNKNKRALCNACGLQYLKFLKWGSNRYFSTLRDAAKFENALVLVNVFCDGEPCVWRVLGK
ncbi:uncharacterized protein LODBEIA_P21930 [Lodderomyces beijingensis]|uniref:GATA-type domain-containing protein n=1 Tax=Lodderomyces beijingensis TaxID=1775926 RepID=A0ABP0ZJC3_9ASCO